jgi:hypothetical protein
LRRSKIESFLLRTNSRYRKPSEAWWNRRWFVLAKVILAISVLGWLGDLSELWAAAEKLNLALMQLMPILVSTGIAEAP